MQANLILVRHGQSIWNKENLFTGWVDVDLSEQGIAEARRAGRDLQKANIKVDIAFTSLLKRAIRTLWIILDEMDQMWIPVEGAWQWNERHYGALQGLNKVETAIKYGEDQVLLWRRSYSVLPPALAMTDEMHPSKDRRYANVPLQKLPSSESLETTLTRVLEYWHEKVAPCLLQGKTVLIVAHGNSLRALLKYLNNISAENILDLNIPTGVPLLMSLDKALKVTQQHFLGDEEMIRQASRQVAEQGKI